MTTIYHHTKSQDVERDRVGIGARGLTRMSRVAERSAVAVVEVASPEGKRSPSQVFER